MNPAARIAEPDNSTTANQRASLMSRFSRLQKLLPLAAICLAAASSCRYGPSAVQPPSISAGKSAQQAMEMFDSNGDELLDEKELETAPGLKAAVKMVDTNNDGMVSTDEIAERIRAWQASRIGMAAVMCTVTLDRQPVAGATVTFEPEPFLGENIRPAVGTTDDLGNVYPSIREEEMASADNLFGMHLGFYRVKVSKVANGKELIPAKYNAQTTLGQQIAPDDPALMKRNVIFELNGS